MDNWGLIKLAGAVPALTLAAPALNAAAMLELAEVAAREKVDILCFPELATCGYSCADLFAQSPLLEASNRALLDMAKASEAWPNLLLCVGAPLVHASRLYNCAILIRGGRILSAVPKTFLPNHNEFYEARWFSPAGDPEAAEPLILGGQSIPFGQKVFCCELAGSGDAQPPLSFGLGLEICEDLWAPLPPSSRLALAGAELICNLSASNELVGKARYRRELVAQQSARLNCAYLYTSSGPDESSTDLVFGGHGLIAENGRLLTERPPLSDASPLFYAIVDLQVLRAERLRNAGFSQSQNQGVGLPQRPLTPAFSAPQDSHIRERLWPAQPFVPAEHHQRDSQADEVLRIQTAGLARRLRHTGLRHCVLGVSGGLDSTLALLVAVRAYRGLGWPLSDIHALTLPGFGTTDRTWQNALRLMRAFGLHSQEINISAAVLQHFSDIGHPPELHDLTYENSQARERTQILMDYANKVNGLVVGTGDLSELALGWCTYNGDHMSMYGVNASVPKTLVQHLVAYQAALFEGSAEPGEQAIGAILRDILATPISPELLPPAQDGKIAQLTEESTGPYLLHDFFLYLFLRYGFGPSKIFYLARNSFAASEPPAFSDAELLKWLERFYRRFFSQQFKRSCLPDGPQVGAVALSPRGSWRMASDVPAALWLGELEQLKKVLKEPSL